MLLGLNLPWTNVFCGYDFGIAPKGWRKGFPSPRDFHAELGPSLRSLHDVGIRAIRVFLLADALVYPETRPYSDYAEHRLSAGMKGTKVEWPRLDAPAPAELSELYVADVRSFFDACAAEGLKVLPSFLSFEAFFPPRIAGDGTVKEGRGSLILGANRDAKAEHVDAFFEATLDRLLAIDDGEGGPHRAVLAWEVVNEPDWCVRKRHVKGEAMSLFLLRGVERIVRAGYTASIGFLRAEVDWLEAEAKARLVELAEQGRYLHQVHYYPSSLGDRLLPTSESPYLDATIIGEMAASDTERALWPDIDVSETEGDPSRFLLGRLEHAASLGYRMAFLWSKNANDDKSGLDAQSLAQLAAFNAANDSTPRS